MRFFKKTNIDFLGVRRRWYIVSSSLIIAGFISLIVKGMALGIDFKGGTELVFSFSRTVEIADLRAALGKIGLEKSEIKSYGTEHDVLIRTSEQAEGLVIGERMKQALQQAFPDLKFEVLKQYKISARIGEELRRGAAYAIVASLIAILAYVAVRFQFIYGLGAVLALFHDVLVTLGFLSILDGWVPGLNLEISQEVIAAFLTIVGVSVNDTVVIFDRIRENLKIYRSLSLSEVMNRSLNDTLSRTIITNGTILAVLIVLLFFGGEVNRAFALTLVIGEITGTYSSIYVASALVLDVSERKKKAS